MKSAEEEKAAVMALARSMSRANHAYDRLVVAEGYDELANHLEGIHLAAADAATHARFLADAYRSQT